MPETILTPVTLWQSFDDTLPLKEVKLNTYSIHSASITNLYFSGRQTAKGRVRIFGVYGEPTIPSKGSILILPDACDTVDPEVVVLGGGVSKAGQTLIYGAKRYFDEYIFHASRSIRFALASLGNDAGAYGAFKLALNAAK